MKVLPPQMSTLFSLSTCLNSRLHIGFEGYEKWKYDYISVIFLNQKSWKLKNEEWIIKENIRGSPSWERSAICKFQVLLSKSYVLGFLEMDFERVFEAPLLLSNSHSWAKFKIVLVRKLEGKLYSFHAKNLSKHNFSIHFFRVVVFPSNFWFQNFKLSSGFTF